MAITQRVKTTMKPARTVRLGKPFTDGGRSITIRYSASAHHCSCGLSFHDIACGDLSAILMNARTCQREHWHRAHLEQWTLILLDQDANEIARFGC